MPVIRDVKEREKYGDKTEKEKLSNMTFKEKADYIWEYYKIPIISVIVGIFIIGSLINRIWINPPKDTFVGIAYYGSYLEEGIQAQIEKDLNQALVEDIDNFSVMSSNYYFTDEDPQMNAVMSQKFVAVISAKELDIVIAIDEAFQALAIQGYIMEASEAFPKAIYDKHKGNMITAKEIIEDNTLDGGDIVLGDEKEYGISLADSTFLEDAGLDVDNLVIGVVLNSARKDNTDMTIEYILD